MQPLRSFEGVTRIGLSMHGVEAGRRYDGSPVLRVGGAFMAGIATHPSAEPGTLVVRATFEDRAGFLEDAPETYYLTDYYEKYPVILARLSMLEPNAARDLLAMSHRLTVPKARRVRRPATSQPCSSAEGPYTPGTGTSSSRK